MKRFSLFVSLLVLVFALNACALQTREDKVLSTIGRYDEKVFYTSGGFQDFTDFAKYTFTAVDLEENPYFEPVSEDDRDILFSFLDNFEDWIEVIRQADPQNEVVVNYAFDRSIIDTEDYFYIYEGEEPYPKFGCYDVWVLDTQTNVLYYFHNNI